MKHIIFTVLCSALLLAMFSVPSHGQLPSGRYGKGKEMREKVVESEHIAGLDLLVGYNRINFLNPVYANNIENGTYLNKGGIMLGGRVNFYPVLLDIMFRKNNFREIKIGGLPEGETISQRGYDISLAYAFLPNHQISSKPLHINPYVGLGYQFSQLCYYCNLKEDDPDNLEVPKNARRTSNPFYKLGVAFNFHGALLELDYRRSINLKNTHAFNGFSIALGFSPKS